MEKENVKNKIVIFDFDYTLVDASDSIVESFRYALPISSVESLSDTVRSINQGIIKIEYYYLG